MLLKRRSASPSGKVQPLRSSPPTSSTPLPQFPTRISRIRYFRLDPVSTSPRNARKNSSGNHQFKLLTIRMILAPKKFPVSNIWTLPLGQMLNRGLNDDMKMLENKLATLSKMPQLVSRHSSCITERLRMKSMLTKQWVPRNAFPLCTSSETV